MSVSVLKKGLPLAVVTVALLVMVGAASASTAEPWWHMSVSSRPSSIIAGTARSEVQEITAEPATSGEYAGYALFELEVEGVVVGLFWNQAEPGPYGLEPASAANIRKALEGAYGAGKVEVEGGPAGTAPVIVRSINEDVDKTVSPIVFKNFFDSHGEYGTGEAEVTTQGRPDGTIVLLASNLGDAASNGATPVTIKGTLPPGVKAVSAKGEANGQGIPRGSVTCSVETGQVASCMYKGALPLYETIEVDVGVVVQGGAKSGELATGSVEGGGAPAAAAGSLKLGFGGEPSFGVQGYEMTAEGEGGAAVTQAGAHPFQLTTTLNLNQTAEGKPLALAKDLEFKLPAGLVGNPTAFPQCSTAEFLEKAVVEGVYQSGACRQETAMGVAITTLNNKGRPQTSPEPIFNLEPEEGEPARFGFYAAVVPIILDTSVRTGEDYGITVSTHNIDQMLGLLASQAIFWGVPGNPVHDTARGTSCLYATLGVTSQKCSPLDERGPAPFLAMPSSCLGEPLVSLVEGDSWQRVSFKAVTSTMPALDGCNKERFEPSIKAAPDVEDASTPSGLMVNVHVPQELQTNANATAESAVKRIEVALPEGVTVNPGGADGLQACSEAQIGFLNKTGPNGELLFTPDYPSCPDQSKIATVTIHTPLLPNPLEGFVYLATPSINGEAGANPFNSLISMYLVAEDPISGTLVKLPMHVSLSATGQLTTTVENPELPFEDAELHFFGGSRAPLATPALCGSYTTNAVFTPWSGNAPVDSSAQFTIDSGPNGSSCFPSPRPFAPGFAAGTTNIQAGAFTPFTTTMSHPDGDQPLGRLSMKLPPGLLGVISSVKLCEERQANEGTCGPESLIGHTVVTAGLGSTPAVVARPGNVYITGPYEGAPYGLTIANPAETGPFDLEKGTPCDCVVVRAKIEVNPLTAQLTVASDPLPTILKGIPLQLQHVNVTVDRPGFTFNPTNCGQMAIEGTMSSSEGASAPVSTPFQATNCATLAFKPTFKVSTSGKTSRKNGASLDVKLSYPKGAFGKDANIRSVKVDLPKQLPSRLTTLQKACPDATFNANPSACPKGSRVGGATTTTPVLPGALSGPVYFVSHGGAKFPELVVVLQGDGVTVDLHGETFISKAGITSSTFRTVPDVPVSTFELKLPTGPHSALAANGNLCKSKLAMPTAFTAQNGLTIHQSTKIAVSGCPKPKKGAGPKK
jgi:hypothetical protein